jgi:hypothetical protein
MGNPAYRYDFGLSYADAQRSIAKDLSDGLQRLGYSVFYYPEDRDFEARTLGKSLVEALASVYANECRFCVVLLSPEYEQSEWTRVEKEAIQGRRLTGDHNFFVPVLVSGSRPQWVPPTILYFSLARASIDDLVKVLHRRAGRPDITPFIAPLAAYRFDQYLKAIETSRGWQKLLNVDLFALPIRLSATGIDSIQGIFQYAKLPGRKISILGKPGCGKTTAVNRIFATAHEQYELIPIRIQREWLQDPSSMDSKVADLIKLDAGSSLRSLEATERLLFVLDGLDQLDQMSTCVRTIGQIASTYFSHSHFLLTCRDEEYRRLDEKPDFVEYQILPLDWDSMKHFILEMRDLDHQQFILSTFQNDEHLRMICDNQFIFLMVLSLLRDRKIPPRLTFKIYEMFMERFIEWERSRKTISRLSLEEIRGSLEELAFQISQGREYRDGISLGSIGNRIPNGVVKSLLQLGFLSNKENIISFVQQTFQECLLASWLFRNKVFPCDFDARSGVLYYKEAYLSSTTLMFYKEMTGFNFLS